MIDHKANEIMEKLGKGENLSLKERIYFEQNVSFQDFYTWAQLTYEIESCSQEYISKIISTFHKKVPKGFETLGFSSKRSKTFKAKNGMSDDELETLNTEVKCEFNANLDELIENSIRYGQVTNDYDVLGKGKVIKNKRNRREYARSGEKRLKAFEKMTSADNEGKADVMLRVVEKDGRPWATNSAKKLLDVGVDVYNYDEGEKFGAGVAVYAKEGWAECMKRLLGNNNFKELSEKTGLTQAALKRIRAGEKPTPMQMLVLGVQYQEAYPDDPTDFVELRPYAFFICRDFNKGERPQPEEPQMHPVFSGIIVEGWTDMTKWILDHIEEKKKDVATDEINKKYLSKYLE